MSTLLTNYLIYAHQFLSCNFSVMIFHYDGIVEGWNELEWSTKVIHIAALNQTKW